VQRERPHRVHDILGMLRVAKEVVVVRIVESHDLSKLDPNDFDTMKTECRPARLTLSNFTRWTLTLRSAPTVIVAPSRNSFACY
jgi:hypothetical protein